ncbi:hypothetical protein DFQ26_004274 [Actinomortierella ambigua]|nr:hypothetical protein DFQ26_004274 [Actinomortierella ambigua]
MSSAAAASKQKSRKGKKAWRKNVDINDIEVNLDELRAEERTTGGKVHQRPNELLFTMDTKGDSKTIHTLRKDRPLKMDEILAERSKVPALAGRKKAASTASAINPVKSTAKISKAERERLLNMIRRKTSNSLFATTPKNLGRRGMTDAVKAAGTYDVWGDDAAGQDEEEAESSEDDKAQDFVKEVITKAPVKAPITLKLRPKAAIPAVKESHPGASYNPTMQDHQNLLRIAHEEELKKLQDMEKLESQLAYPKELDEMVPFDDRTGGLLEGSDEEEEEEDDDEEGEEGDDETTDGKKKVKGKKTQAERNRLARAQETMKKELEIKKQKELLKQANQLKNIIKTVEEQEAELEKKRTENETKKEEKARAGMKRVGKFNIPKERTHVQLQEELAESLRQLKPEGSLMKDRFQSFVERNIIEPRMPVAKRRRYKLKTYEKHSYKRFDNPNHA